MESNYQNLVIPVRVPRSHTANMVPVLLQLRLMRTFDILSDDSSDVMLIRGELFVHCVDDIQVSGCNEACC